MGLQVTISMWTVDSKLHHAYETRCMTTALYFLPMHISQDSEPIQWASQLWPVKFQKNMSMFFDRTEG